MVEIPRPWHIVLFKGCSFDEMRLDSVNIAQPLHSMNIYTANGPHRSPGKLFLTDFLRSWHTVFNFVYKDRFVLASTCSTFDGWLVVVFCLLLHWKILYSYVDVPIIDEGLQNFGLFYWHLVWPLIRKRSLLCHGFCITEIGVGRLIWGTAPLSLLKWQSRGTKGPTPTRVPWGPVLGEKVCTKTRVFKISLYVIVRYVLYIHVPVRT